MSSGVPSMANGPPLAEPTLPKGKKKQKCCCLAVDIFMVACRAQISSQPIVSIILPKWCCPLTTKMSGADPASYVALAIDGELRLEP